MRWFLDTEFNEDGRTIELISIALVSEAGESYYAVSSEFDPAACGEWLQKNVLDKLPPRETWKPRAQIRDEIRALTLRDNDRPEFWAYFADYDWVVFCQLFGRMIDLPAGMPHLCFDLKQAMCERGIGKAQLPPQEGAEHDALADATWVRDAYLALSRRR